MALAGEEVPHSADLEKRAQVWQNVGIGLLDALHQASAELAGVDRFATCDDVLLHKAGRIISKMQVVAILDLVKELFP